MRITKTFTIHEVGAAAVSNAPFRITLEAGRREGEESSLVLDAETCTHHHLPQSLDLVGRTLACSFTSRALRAERGDRKGRADREPPRRDDLVIRELKKTEVVSFFQGEKHLELSRTLTLSSFDPDEGTRFHSVPCPFYRLTLDLSEAEYEACKALPPHSVFKVVFRLA